METTFFDNIDFNLPKNQSNVIKVIGVGGGGSNAVNHMFKKGIQGVDFVICNTDAQALKNSPVPIKIQLGASLTEGLGAGANPEVGERSAIESVNEINTMFGEKTKMVFITVGMGGGTGTGAAPVIAKIAREQNLLTVAIVTTPFGFEGQVRNEQAQKGIEKLRENVDSIIVINNNKLREVYGNLGFKAGFSKADEVLSTAACGIAEVITHHYTQNIDFKDANTVLANSGSAIMGSAVATGSNRSQEAITKALESPLLNDNKITGAKNVLLLIVSGTSEITIDEIGEINDYIQSEAKGNVNIIMGVGEDEALGESVAVTIVATGFNKEQQTEISKTESKRVIFNLEDLSSKLETTFISKNKISEKDTSKKQADSIQKTINKNDVEDKIVHQLLEEPLGQISLFDIEVNDVTFITKKSIDIKDEENRGFLNPEISKAINAIKNDLVKEKLNEQTSDFETTALISTTKNIRNMNIVYDEVLDEEEFIITSVIADIEVIDHEVITANIEEKNQITMAFDLPLDIKKTNDELVEGGTEISIKDDLSKTKKAPIIGAEIVSENKVYNLDDCTELEHKIRKTAEEDVTLKLESKIITTINEDIVDKKEISPLNSTINELKSRADDRRQKMKDFNYKFANRTKQNIDDLEKQPAYKRNNIELDDNLDVENEQSRISLDIDGKDINFRSNNSFLHDNVD
ncbi:MAG: cell division protein FtsZ [Flavobacteriaceae bacterium]|nr:cell division protein FtsZ [Flavobacteriaceae bacterium]